MKRSIGYATTLALFLYVTVSCGMVEIPKEGEFPYHGGNGESLPQEDEQAGPENGTTCYLSGVRYPEGHDWIGDFGNTTDSCTLFLLKNGIPIVEVPAGYAYGISPDADTHHILDGHLYTDFSTEEETIIRCDGKEIIRFDGRERINSMIIDEDGLHTLTEWRDGKGISLRLNGKIILQKKDATIIRGLYEDNGHLHFFFREERNDGTGEVGQRRIYQDVTDGECRSIPLENGLVRIYDYLHVRNKGYMVGTLENSAPASIMSENEETELTGWSSVRKPHYRMLYDGKNIFVSGEDLESRDGISRVWSGTRLFYSLKYNEMTEECFLERNDLGFMVSSKYGKKERYLIWKNRKTSVDRKLDWIPGNGHAFSDGHLYILMSEKENHRPVIWSDTGKTVEYDFNGYFTGISLPR